MNISRPTQALAGAAGALSGRTPPKRRRIGPFRTDGEAGAISEINTTPLIDVMLVLLIMFIITIPMATHKVPLDLPGPPPLTPLPPQPFHQLEIAATGALLWNGESVSPDLLRGRLSQLAADPALPELRVHADSEARYERVDQVLAWIRTAGVQRLGFVGNEQYGRTF